MTETLLGEPGHGEWPWDGRGQSYRPRPGWDEGVAEAARFHAEVAADLDPVTYEVIRHRLWTINLVNGEILTRLAGSPVFQALDFSMSILTHDGEVVVNSPYAQVLNAGSSFAVRYILEHLSGDPGIADGDVFLTNDPWIGAVHQMDVTLAAPVMVDGRLFAWVSNSGHQVDLGGMSAHGTPVDVYDVYSEPFITPPVKVVESGRMRPDFESMYLRQSRAPDVLALDLRAQVSGCVTAREQLLEVCEEYGATTVKACCRQMIESAERRMRSKLARVPDGTWSETHYYDSPRPGSRRTQRVSMAVRKASDRLEVTNAGTDPAQPGPTCSTFSSLVGAMYSAVGSTMLYEELYALGGATRVIDYDVQSGLLNCAEHPAPVSAGLINTHGQVSGLTEAVSRMLVCDPDLKRDFLGCTGGWPSLILTGRELDGRYFGTVLMDPAAKGSSARSYADGVDSGGVSNLALMRVVNVEEEEEFFPIILLYRRQRCDSAGAGRWRGGGTIESAFVPYGAQEFSIYTSTSGSTASLESAPGSFGGYPSPTSQYRVFEGTDIHRVLHDQRVPQDLDGELDSERVVLLGGRSSLRPLGPNDVVELRAGGAGGYGDPHDRAPEAVAVDVHDGWVSIAAAREVYGVVLAEDGSVDGRATGELRDAVIAERRGWPLLAEVLTGESREGQDRSPASGEPPVMVHEYVVAGDRDGFRALSCARCGEVLADYRGDYRMGLRYDEQSITAIPGVADPGQFLDEPFVLRRYCCPSCAVLMATEVRRADEPHRAEMRMG